MYRALTSAGLVNMITGAVYREGQRPANSDKEDVVINSLSLTTSHCPQTAITNVNIFVPDKEFKASNAVTLMPDTAKMKLLTDFVMSALRRAVVEGVKFNPSSQTIIAEPAIKQHYVNIRVDWNIQIN